MPTKAADSYAVQHDGRRTALIIQVQTDSGISGIGEAFAENEAWARAIAGVIKEILEPLILGENPSNVKRIWDKMHRGSGRMGLIVRGISGIEIALLDITGKDRGEPIYEILGGRCRDKIEAYLSLQPLDRTENLVSVAREYVEQGFHAIKLHQKSVESVKALREALGDDVKIMLDVNNAWRPKTAIRIAKTLERYDISWLEEPVWPPGDIDGLAQVTAAAEVPIAGGENEWTRRGFRELLVKRAVDIFQPDITKAGGLLECKKMCSMAEILDIPFAPHCWGYPIGLAADLHLVSSMSNSLYIEVPPPLAEEILDEPISIENGNAWISEKPGLGIELDRDIVARYAR